MMAQLLADFTIIDHILEICTVTVPTHLVDDSEIWRWSAVWVGSDAIWDRFVDGP